MLKITNLKASVGGAEILKGVDFEVGSGQVHVLMGPNGSGKSTLAQVVAGHPSYKIIDGRLWMLGRDISKLTPDKRAKLGIFLGFQHPVEVPGVSVFNFLRRAKDTSIKKNPKSKIQNPKSISVFRQELLEHASSLKLSDDILRRPLNEGFSGGEKKRNEILQMMALKPKLVILDEIDSGLDVDGLKLVAEAVKKFKKKNPKSTLILITHYARILKYLKPDFVHVMVEGKIVRSGKIALARKIEEKGYRLYG
jgi:Fe-S cluster assembly ATP-binding protein